MRHDLWAVLFALISASSTSSVALANRCPMRRSSRKCGSVEGCPLVPGMSALLSPREPRSPPRLSTADRQEADGARHRSTAPAYLAAAAGVVTAACRRHASQPPPIARYCNWLSKTESIPEDQWCYEQNNESEYAEGMRPAADFLKRTGYRLPTEAEWEFACRADAATSRYYGADDSLLPKYAWFLENAPGDHSQPTGMLKPNAFGLFDMLGNAMEWCHDGYGDYGVANGGELNDAGDMRRVFKNEGMGRVVRGGAFLSRSRLVRCSARFYYQPDRQVDIVGFRPARTYVH